MIAVKTVDVVATEPRMRLGEIGQRLGFDVTANFLASIGFAPVAQEKGAKLYAAADFPRICAALNRHISAVAQAKAA